MSHGRVTEEGRLKLNLEGLGVDQISRGGGCQKLSQRQGSEASDAGYTGELCGEGQAVYAFAPAAVARRHTFGGFNEQRFLASCAVSTQHGAGRHSDSFFYAAGLMGRHRRTYAHTHGALPRPGGQLICQLGAGKGDWIAK